MSYYVIMTETINCTGLFHFKFNDDDCDISISFHSRLYCFKVRGTYLSLSIYLLYLLLPTMPTNILICIRNVQLSS